MSFHLNRIQILCCTSCMLWKLYKCTSVFSRELYRLAKRKTHGFLDKHWITRHLKCSLSLQSIPSGLLLSNIRLTTPQGLNSRYFTWKYVTRQKQTVDCYFFKCTLISVRQLLFIILQKFSQVLSYIIGFFNLFQMQEYTLNLFFSSHVACSLKGSLLK